MSNYKVTCPECGAQQRATKANGAVRIIRLAGATHGKIRCGLCGYIIRAKVPQ